MRILVVNPLIPHPEHSIRAANVVIFEMITELARRPGVEVGFLKIDEPNSPPPDELDQLGLAKMREHGITILEPFRLIPPAPRQIRYLSEVDLQFFYPYLPNRPAALAAAAPFGAEVLLVPWNEAATVLFADFPGLKFAYYGNPDCKVFRARTRMQQEMGQLNEPQAAQKELLAQRLEALHLAEIRRYEILGDVAANDAEYYQRTGHPNAFYIQNLWPDRFGPRWAEMRRQLEPAGSRKIIANIGKLSGTANTIGLEYLGREILPALRQALAGEPFELHILGALEPHPQVARLLEQPEFRRRGFVKDIDAELLSAPVFLCVNNGTHFNVGHTRYLHAWSLGCCVVAHRNASLAMPEIADGHNALLGGDPAEIAALVARALAEPELRARIGQNGYQTLTTAFKAARVVDTIVAKIEQARAGRPAQ
jgi:hypothetical protein